MIAYSAGAAFNLIPATVIGVLLYVRYRRLTNRFMGREVPGRSWTAGRTGSSTGTRQTSATPRVRRWPRWRGTGRWPR